MQAIREILHTLFNLKTTSRALRYFMLAWTSFFSAYEITATIFSSQHLMHFAFAVVQTTLFVVWVRCQVVEK